MQPRLGHFRWGPLSLSDLVHKMGTGTAASSWGLCEDGMRKVGGVWRSVAGGARPLPRGPEQAGRAEGSARRGRGSLYLAGVPAGKAGENTWLSGCQGGCSLAETPTPHPSHLLMGYLSAVRSEPRTHLVQEHLQEQVGGHRAWDCG